MAVAVPRETKKMLLFASSANRFWSTVLQKGDISQNQVSDFMGVSHATIPAWKNGGTINRVVAINIFKNIRTNLDQPKKGKFPPLGNAEHNDAIEILNGFEEDFLNDSVSVYEAAKRLGMTMQQCQIIIDDVIYKRSPLFPRMYFDTREEAEATFGAYGGMFQLWVKRQVANGKRRDLWLQAALRVRYILEVQGGYVIRCKLNAPIIDPEPTQKYWEYDGFLVQKQPNKIFWMFEKRRIDQYDQFHCITGLGRPACCVFDNDEKRQRTMSGMYLTTGQDEFQSIETDRVLLQRKFGLAAGAEKERALGDERLMREFMHSSPQIIDDETRCARLDNFCDKFTQAS